MKTEDNKEKLTFEQFLKEYDGQSCEWVRGKAVPLSPVTFAHAKLCGWLQSLLYCYVRQKQIGRIFSSQFSFKLGHTFPSRSPDIGFVKASRMTRMQSNFFDGAPNLIIEITSPSTRRMDRETKFKEYENAEVQEYWMLDPHTKKADFYCLNDQGKFERVLADAKGIYRSLAVEDFWVKTEWFWHNPLPDLFDTARELGLIP